MESLPKNKFYDLVFGSVNPVSVVVATGVVLTLSSLFPMFGRDKSRVPPLAPGGILKTIWAVSGGDMPWFMLRTARDLKSNIFRLSLPLPGCPMVVVVGDTQTLRAIMTDPLTIKPPQLFESFSDVTGGILTMPSTNGVRWHAKRKAVLPAFSSNNIKRMNSVATEKTEEWITSKLEPTIERGEAFDVAHEMLDIVFSALCETAFEYKMDVEEKEVFHSELNLSLLEFDKANKNPLRRMFGFLIPERRRAKLASQECIRIAHKMINNYKSLESPTKNTIIDLIMRSDAYKNDEERAAEIFTYVIVGHDTTGFTLAFILSELSKNPLEQTRLRQDLLTYSAGQWGKSEVLKAVIKEAMRLHTVTGGGIGRTIGKNMHVPINGKDVVLPKGTIAMTPYILLHRDPATYANADAFIPSRWENPSVEETKAFLPFGIGKMNCVGQSLATAEIQSIIPRLISEFEFHVEDEGSITYFYT